MIDCGGYFRTTIIIYQKRHPEPLDFKEWEDLYMLDSREVKFRRDAEHEMDKVGVFVEDIIQGIRDNKPCPDRWMRKKDHFETCFKYGHKFIRVVYIVCNPGFDCESIHVIHVGEARNINAT